MGIFGGASSASSSQTLSNTVSISPIFNMGSDNDTKSGFDSKTDAAATSSATAKDEFGMAASAGVALGGGSASGGPASMQRSGDAATDIQPNRSAAMGGMSQNNMLLIGGGVVVLGIVGYALTRKKG